MNNEEKELIQLMIESGQNLNESIDDSGMTPLLVVAHEADPELVLQLVEAGADVNQANSEGMTPLMAACDAEEEVDTVLEVIATLVEAGADINAMSKNGITPLFLAVCWDEEEIAEALIENGADIDKAISGAKLQIEAQSDEAEEFFEVIADLEMLKK